MKTTRIAIRFGLALCAIFLLNGCASNLSAQAAAPGKGESLYKRLGGYDAIATGLKADIVEE